LPTYSVALSVEVKLHTSRERCIARGIFCWCGGSGVGFRGTVHASSATWGSGWRIVVKETGERVLFWRYHDLWATRWHVER
jgi:hypothetical protein